MKNKSRRSFLKNMAGLGAGAVAAPILSAKNVFAEHRKGRGDKDMGMLYDATKCIGCKACEVSCKQANNMPVEYGPEGIWDAPRDLSSKTKNIIKLYKGENEQSFVKRQCMHCVDPACVSACPVSALVKQHNGAITWSKDACVGCRYCQTACPFNIPKYEFDSSYGNIVKCDLCSGNGLLAVGQTACTNVCPTQAVMFGRQKDLLKIAKKRLLASPGRYSGKVYGETDGGGTGVIYLAGVSFDKLGFPKLPEYSSARVSEGIQHTIYYNMIAPMAIYFGISFVAYRNLKKDKKTKGVEDGSC